MNHMLTVLIVDFTSGQELSAPADKCGWIACRVPELIFRQHQSQLMADLYKPDIAGIYELQLPLDFRYLPVPSFYVMVGR